MATVLSSFKRGLLKMALWFSLFDRTVKNLLTKLGRSEGKLGTSTDTPLGDNRWPALAVTCMRAELTAAKSFSVLVFAAVLNYVGTLPGKTKTAQSRNDVRSMSASAP